MKKLVLVFAIIMTSLMSFAQGGLFDKYEDMEGVGSGVVNSKMFQMISSIDIDMDDPDAAAMFEMVKKIKSLNRPTLKYLNKNLNKTLLILEY